MMFYDNTITEQRGQSLSWNSLTQHLVIPSQRNNISVFHKKATHRAFGFHLPTNASNSMDSTLHEGWTWVIQNYNFLCVKQAFHHWTHVQSEFYPAMQHSQDHLVMSPLASSISEENKTKIGDGGNRTPDFLYAKQTFYHWTTSPWWILLH